MTPFDLWRSGISLADTVGRSETGRLWAKRRAEVLAAYRRLQNDPRSPLFDRLESTARLQALAQEWEEQKILLEEAREAVRRRLCTGELRACGFVGEPGHSQQLAAVPPEIWRDNRHIDWDGGEVSDGVVRFLDIRIVWCAPVRLDGDRGDLAAAHLGDRRRSD
jgi:hypothetical protein